jgi:hypothetical protein
MFLFMIVIKTEAECCMVLRLAVFPPYDLVKSCEEFFLKPWSYNINCRKAGMMASFRNANPHGGAIAEQL